MIITIKKKTLLTIAASVLASILAIGLAVGFGTKRVQARNGILGKTVVIDAGHGGRDGGVAGKTTGVKESDINLSISKSLRRFLEDKGYKVVMTRTTTDGLYGLSGQNRKLKDMEARKKTILEAKPDLVVSIHQNSFPSRTVRGAQVFYDKSSESGLKAASTVQNILNLALGSERLPKVGDYYMLQCSPYASILVECGFLSNPEEEKLLISAPYQEKVAYTIFTAIHSVLSPGIIEKAP
jgi:N-acetylmuramoyl-L-alanine amidase